jgi:hypothetical protein
MSRSVSEVVISTPRQWSLLAGITFFVAGFFAALSVTITPIFTIFYGGVGLSKQAFPLLVAVATGLVGGISWWLVVERLGRPTRERGAIVWDVDRNTGTSNCVGFDSLRGVLTGRTLATER